ncbi:phage tail sheath gpL-like [Thalassospira sp. MBR-102]|uniref:phage tail sheath subtilisin-like domain-containing protein n=1 Tax=Thalassospira sp. MBR-102 TaxID=3156466 RepID=UPI003395F0B2
MAIPNESFNEIAINARVAGKYIETSGSRVNGLVSNHVALLIGQSLASGSANDAELLLVPGTGAAAGEMFGKGANLALMVEAYRQNNTTMTLYAIALPDLVSGVKASVAMTFTGAATESRALAVYVAGVRVFVPVVTDDTPADVAASVAAAITALPNLPVTATATAGVVTFEAKNAGEIGNDIRIQVALRGVMSGEKVPAGISIAVPNSGFLQNGSGNPDIAGALAAIGSQKVNYVGFPWTDGGTLDAISEWFEGQQKAGVENDVKGFTARRGTVSELLTFGTSRNDRFVSTIGTYDAPGPAWMRAARYLGQMSGKLFNHSARPLAGVELVGEMAPPEKSRLEYTDKNTLMFAGVTVTDEGRDGKVRLNMPITMYQTNEFGDLSEAYLLVNTVAQLGRIRDELASVLDGIRMQRPILVDDGTPVDDGIPYVTPRSVRASLIAHYDYMVGLGLVEDVDGFAERLEVSKSPTNSYRLNMIYRPDLSNPLYLLAAKIEFELDFRDF